LDICCKDIELLPEAVAVPGKSWCGSTCKRIWEGLRRSREAGVLPLENQPGCAWAICNGGEDPFLLAAHEILMDVFTDVTDMKLPMILAQPTADHDFTAMQTAVLLVDVSQLPPLPWRIFTFIYFAVPPDSRAAPATAFQSAPLW
jgi:hypothetical protein